MKNILILLICLIACNAQTVNQKTKSILTKTAEYNLPINISDMIGEIHMNEKSYNLTETECINLKAFNEDWLNNKSYSYRSFCYFKLNNDLLGIIYNRSYYPIDILDEKSEYILSIINKNDELISSILVQGSYGDEQVFFGTINKNYEITIFNETTDEKGEIEVTKSKYVIKENGTIEKRE
ncbi:MAG: hypothetical protein KAT68_09025 [Bacteroidales bacterium]|nr:hypothetical protein [Bacteroidales bacterium]